MKKVLFGFIVCTAAVCAQPAITGPAVNAASQVPPGMPGHGVAQGARFLLKGDGLGPETEARNDAFPLSTSLEGISAKVTVGETTADVWILSAQAKSVLALLPSTTPVGKGKVLLTAGEQTAEADIEVVERAFGIQVRNGTGNGPAAAKIVEGGAENSLTVSARPGAQVSIRGTGLGAREGDEGAGPVAGPIEAAVEVFVGGKSANVVSKGRIEGPGLDEIVIEVPGGVQGCFVPVVVKIGSSVSNYATLSISASDGPCIEPAGFSGNEISRLEAGAEFRVGSLSFDRASISQPPASVLTDTAAGSFLKYKPEELAGARSSASVTSIGGCTVMYVVNDSARGLEPLTVEGLDAGSTLSVNGPKGAKSIPMQKGSFSGELGQGTVIALPFPVPGLPPNNAYLEEGSYTVNNGQGGADVGPFNISFTIGKPLEWKNRDAVGAGAPIPGLSRAADVPIEWTGGGASDLVTIMGFSFLRSAKAGGIFLCTEKASAGRFVIPSLVLLSIPASTDPGMMMVSSQTAGEATRFSAPGIDYGSFHVTFSSAKTLRYE